MHIVIYGAGGVGGYFGGKLAQSNNNVTFIARGKHLNAINEKGLTVKSIKGNFHLPKVNAQNNLDNIEKVDLIILAVKTFQLNEIFNDLKKIIKNETVILPLLNGIKNYEILSKEFGKDKVIKGLCKIYSKIEEYGVVNHFGITPQIIIGEHNNNLTSRIKNIQKLFIDSDIKTFISEDIDKDLWSKYMFICTIGGVGCILKQNIGNIRENEYSRNLLNKCLVEIYDIAKKNNVNFDESIVDKTMISIDNMPFNSESSMQRDIMQNKPSEIYELTGEIISLADKHNLNIPINKFIFDCLNQLTIESKNQKNNVAIV